MEKNEKSHTHTDPTEKAISYKVVHREIFFRYEKNHTPFFHHQKNSILGQLLDIFLRIHFSGIRQVDYFLL